METTILKRIADQYLLNKVKRTNLVIIAGARSTSKTTLVQHNLPDWRYVTLMNPYDRMNAFNDPEGWLKWLGDKVIIDDIQYNLEFAKMIYHKYIQDELNQKVVIVTNHHLGAPIMSDLSIVIPTMGFSNAELIDSNVIIPSPNQWIIKGGNAKLLLTTANPLIYYQEYISRSTENLQSLGVLNKPGNFVQLLKMLAGRTGFPLLHEELSELCDVSIPTIKTWINLLEQYFIILRWLPYHNDYGKRINKKQVVYFSSTGLSSALLNIRSTEDLEYSPYKTNLFNNAVVYDIIRQYYSNEMILQPYYWQEQNRNKIDLILDTPTGTKCWKIINHSTVKPMHTRSLERFAKISGVPKENMHIVYYGKDIKTVNGFKCFPWNTMKRDSLHTEHEMVERERCSIKDSCTQ